MRAGLPVPLEKPGKSAPFRLGLVLLLPVIMILASGPAPAHFLLNLNVRIFHIERISDGLELHVRMPMPYLVAGLLGSMQDDGLPEPAPFTVNRMKDGRLIHLVDIKAYRQDPVGLGKIAAAGLHVIAGGDERILNPEVIDTRLYRIGTQPALATLAEAKTAFNTAPSAEKPASPLYVGDAMVDVKLAFRTDGPVYPYQISSSLDPGLPDQDRTANLILDYGPGGTKVFRSQGLLQDPVKISRSSFAAIMTFVTEGVRHILEGLDHVLFVLCLVIGARTLSALAWRVTGFTVGHSITLAAGFFGFVPKSAWFIPAVETTIAMSIVYAAAIALWPSTRKQPRERSMVLVTVVIGLLHGLGFSFVLKNILQVTSPDIWQSLLAFNVGVEIGQLAIVACVWPVLWIVGRKSSLTASRIRITIAALCACIALYWTAERLIDLALTV